MENTCMPIEHARGRMKSRKNEYRYQLYIKRAVLQAHIAAMDETIHQIENHVGLEEIPFDDFRMDDEDCFEKYFKLVEEIR
jgi:hypothetical protein